MLVRWLTRIGLTAIALAALFIVLGFFRPLYERVVPGDEGGIAYVLFIYAYTLVPVGIVMLCAGFAIKCGEDRYPSKRKNFLASILFGASIWWIVRAILGSIDVKWWAVTAGAFAAALVYVLLHVRARSRRSNGGDARNRPTSGSNLGIPGH